MIHQNVLVIYIRSLRSPVASTARQIRAHAREGRSKPC